MKAQPLVFPLLKEQSKFMTIIMGILTFLAVLAFGIVISISTGVIKWNNQWNNYATVQVIGDKNADFIQEILNKNTSKIENTKKITNDEIKNLMQPWLSDTSNIENYIPYMWEIKFKTESDLKFIEQEIKPHAKFLTHSSALKNPMNAGWKLIAISSVVMFITLFAIVFCISYISKNTALLHKRELEILNQIGATDSFIVKQMRKIVTKICAQSTGIGFVLASLILLLILSISHSTRVGLMAMINLNLYGWILLILLPIFIIILSIFITEKTTLKILSQN
ncbi:MAG: cell division protein FtsX [Alphaproteobacteria bacterium]